MDIKEKREKIEDVCRINSCGFVNPEVFEQGYSPQTLGVYGILASHNNGKLSGRELLMMYAPEEPESQDVLEACMCALWILYEDGFIELNTLLDKDVESVYEQLGLDKLAQANNE